MKHSGIVGACRLVCICSFVHSNNSVLFYSSFSKFSMILFTALTSLKVHRTNFPYVPAESVAEKKPNHHHMFLISKSEIKVFSLLPNVITRKEMLRFSKYFALDFKRGPE